MLVVRDSFTVIEGVPMSKEKNNAIIEVLRLIRDEIDSLPGLKSFHQGEPLYDEAIEEAKDQVFSSIEDMITFIETDDGNTEGERDGNS
jgi:hypothetical protein